MSLLAYVSRRTKIVHLRLKRAESSQIYIWVMWTSMASISATVASRIVTSPTRETQAEVTVIREVLTVTTETNDEHHELLQKWDLLTTIRVRSCASRFIPNCRAKRQLRITGSISTQETSRQMKFWEKRAQVRCQGTSRFQEDQQRLNLQKNANGLYESRGRIHGDHPIYLSDDALFRKSW